MASSSRASAATSPATELYGSRAIDINDHADVENALSPEQWDTAFNDWWHAAAHAPHVRRMLELEYDIPAFFLKHEKLLAQFKSFLHEQPGGMAAMRPALLAVPPHTLAAANISQALAEAAARPFLSAVQDFLETVYSRQLATFRRARRLADLQNPHAWFPAARRIRRRWQLHLGPTNSGKTHAAAGRLLAASTGVYMSPLRLLAWEMYERMVKSGLRCALRTGQERLGPEDATHISCTVEAAQLSRDVDVAVLDEVQLITDPARGAAWTRALLGVQAGELHICGAAEPPGLLEILQRMALDCGDTVSAEIRPQMVPLLAEERPLGGLADVLPGDCVVCFTRRDVMLTKAELEKLGRPPSVIYGSLPPKVRREQAALFNDTASGRNVLVASDAIGMGLNLEIRRVVFKTLKKFDGQATRRLYGAEIRQIAGRAGRFAGRYSNCGLVNCLSSREDLALLREALGLEGSPGLGSGREAPRAGVFPTAGQLETFGRALESELGRLLPFPEILERFLALAAVSPHYFVASADNVLELSRALADIHLPLADTFSFAQTPVSVRDAAAVAALHDFARRYAEAAHVPFPSIVLAEPTATVTPRHIFELEELHRVCDVYHWLSVRFPDAFRDAVAADAARKVVAHRISEALRQPLAILADDPDGRSFFDADDFIDEAFLA